MSIHAHLTRLESAGIRLSADGGRLVVDSPAPLTDEQRGWLKRHKAQLLAALSAPSADTPRRLWLVKTAGETRSASFCPPATVAEVRRAYPDVQSVEPEPEPEPGPAPADLPPEVEAIVNRWLDHIGEHDPESRAEVLGNCARDPNGAAGLLRLIADAGINAASPIVEPVAEPVTCATCRSFQRDRIGDGSGLGRCRIDALASRKTPALWPYAQHHCKDWRKQA
jgi:hypothetical protein